jgi:hypothetical protein
VDHFEAPFWRKDRQFQPAFLQIPSMNGPGKLGRACWRRVLIRKNPQFGPLANVVQRLVLRQVEALWRPLNPTLHRCQKAPLPQHLRQRTQPPYDHPATMVTPNLPRASTAAQGGGTERTWRAMPPFCARSRVARPLSRAPSHSVQLLADHRARRREEVKGSV